jgi:hypothetical protein
LNTYPNPVTEVLYVSVPLSEDESSHLEIFDAFGKKVFEKFVVAETTITSIDIKDIGLSKGIYNLHVINGGNDSVSLFMIQYINSNFVSTV